MVVHPSVEESDVNRIFRLYRWKVPAIVLLLTIPASVVIHDNMKARRIEQSRTVINETSFFEVALWQLPAPVPGSKHPYKYRPAVVVNGECILRYDNERGKGDHRHIESREEAIEFHR